LVIKQSIRQARDRVLTGTVLSESFALERLFPSLVIRMLKVGESTGALDNIAIEHQLFLQVATSTNPSERCRR